MEIMSYFWCRFWFLVNKLPVKFCTTKTLFYKIILREYLSSRSHSTEMFWASNKIQRCVFTRESFRKLLSFMTSQNLFSKPKLFCRERRSCKITFEETERFSCPPPRWYYVWNIAPRLHCDLTSCLIKYPIFYNILP